jgi:hypothetical protein
MLKKVMLGAGKIALNYWYKGVVAEIKTANYDITTEADIAIEKYLSQGIKKYFLNAHHRLNYNSACKLWS